MVQLYNLLFFLNFFAYDVSIKPGEIIFDLILYLAISTANDLFNPVKADLDEAYPDNSLKPFLPTIDPIFTIDPDNFFL